VSLAAVARPLPLRYDGGHATLAQLAEQL